MRQISTGLVFFVACVAVGGAVVDAQLHPRSPVTQIYINRIHESFVRESIRGGSVAVDYAGRIELTGVYDDERQVDRAFSIAQTHVGVRWVSPVTPDQIKVKQWEECLSRIFSGERCGPTARMAPTEVGADDSPPAPTAKKYALVVGAGRFVNGIQPLRYANKDAYDFYAYLIGAEGARFRPENVILLRDEYATRAGVVRALDEIRRRAVEDDLVLLFFSSHGTPPDKFGGVHVVTYDSEVKPRERIWQTSVTDEILRDFVQNVRSKRLIVVMDACYSNGAYAGVAGFLPPGGKSLETASEEGYGRSSRYMAQRLLGAKDLVLDDQRSDTTIARRDGWGKILISASNAGERSWESDQLRNSVFTGYFIEGLRRHQGSIREAFEYARPLVHQHVKREKGNDIEQNPQLTPSRRSWSMSIAASQ